MKTSTLPTLALAGLGLALTSTLTAQITPLVSWSFTGMSLAGTNLAGASVFSVTNVSNSGSPVSGGAQGSGTVNNLVAGGNSGTGLNFIAPYAQGTASTEAGSGTFYNVFGFGTTPVSTHYVSFLLTMGATVDASVSALNGISFNLASGGTSVRGVEVTYRIGDSGGFTSLGTTAAPTATSNQFGLFTFNLPAPASIAASSLVEFRLLGYAPGTGQSVRLDTITINATVIPEPSSAAALLGLGALGFVAARRRRRA